MEKRFEHILALDFETYYDREYSLRKLSTTEYIRDPRFKVQCMATRLLPVEEQTTWVPGDEVEEVLRDVDWTKTALLAHHAHFDGLILSHHYGVHPCYYLCTLSMARPLHGGAIRNDLGSVARHYGAGNKLPDVLDKTKGIRDLDPARLEQLGEYCVTDVDIMISVFSQMLPKYPQSELDLIHHTVKAYAQPVLRVDVPLAQRCLANEKRARTRTLNKIRDRVIRATGHADMLKALRSPDVFARLLESEGVESPTKVSVTTGRVTYAFSKADLAFQALKHHKLIGVRALFAAKLAANSATRETLPARLLSHAQPALPIYLNYGKAHTFRWSGGDKLGPQNFPRDGNLRRCLRAPPHHKLVVVDSGQIEARVNAWLAGETELLERFRRSDHGEDKDPYCYMADEIYGGWTTKADKKKRFVGKATELGAGYQMGASMFAHALRAGLMGTRVDITDEEACRIIYDAYRSNRKKIVAQWTTMDGLLKTIAGEKGQTTPHAYGPLMFRHNAIDLPNGMTLRYPRMHFPTDPDSGAALENGNFTYYGETGPTKIYGGKLTENVVQALARIVVAEQALRIAERYDIVLLVHDEIVLCVKNRFAKRALRELTEAMKEPLDWCADLPVAAEGEVSNYYVKP